MINITKSDQIFQPEIFGKKDIHIIGVGATGSQIVIQLIKLGVPPSQIKVWDFDVVEAHNIANQAFRDKDIGKQKVVALRELCQEFNPDPIKIYDERVTNEHEGIFSGFVFILTDTMESRREIYEVIKIEPNINWIIETRMGVEIGTIFTINPQKISSLPAYEKSLEWKDDDTPVSACGTNMAVGASANLVASIAVWQFIRASNYTFHTTKEAIFPQAEPYSKVMFSLRPYRFITSMF